MAFVSQPFSFISDFLSLRSTTAIQHCATQHAALRRQLHKCCLIMSGATGGDEDSNDELVISYDNMYDVMRNMGLEVPKNPVDKETKRKSYPMPKEEVRRRYRQMVGIQEEGVDAELIDDNTQEIDVDIVDYKKNHSRVENKGESELISDAVNETKIMDSITEKEKEKKKEKTARSRTTKRRRRKKTRKATENSSASARDVDEQIYSAAQGNGVVRDDDDDDDDDSGKTPSGKAQSSLDPIQIATERDTVTVIRNALQKSGHGMQYRVQEREAPNPELDYDIEEEALKMLRGTSKRIMAHDIHAKYQERLKARGTLFDDLKEDKEGLFPRREAQSDSFSEKMRNNLEMALAYMGSHSRESGSFANLKPFKERRKRAEQNMETLSCTAEKDSSSLDAGENKGDALIDTAKNEELDRQKRSGDTKWECFDEDAFLEKHKDRIEESKNGTLILRKKKIKRGSKKKGGVTEEVAEETRKTFPTIGKARKRGRPRKGESLDDLYPLGDPDYSKLPPLPATGPFRRVAKRKVGQTTDFINTTNYHVGRELKGPTGMDG